MAELHVEAHPVAPVIHIDAARMPIIAFLASLFMFYLFLVYLLPVSSDETIVAYTRLREG